MIGPIDTNGVHPPDALTDDEAATVEGAAFDPEEDSDWEHSTDITEGLEAGPTPVVNLVRQYEAVLRSKTFQSTRPKVLNFLEERIPNPNLAQVMMDYCNDPPQTLNDYLEGLRNMYQDLCDHQCANCWPKISAHLTPLLQEAIKSGQISDVHTLALLPDEVPGLIERQFQAKMALPVFEREIALATATELTGGEDDFGPHFEKLTGYSADKIYDQEIGAWREVKGTGALGILESVWRKVAPRRTAKKAVDKPYGQDGYEEDFLGKIVLPFRKDLAEYFIGGAVTTPETWRRTKEIAPALAAYFDENADRIADLIQQHIFDLPAYPKTWGECSEECQKLTWEATVIGLTDLAVELFDGQLVVFTKGSQNPLIETLAKPQGRKVFGIGAYQPFKNFPKI